LIGYLKNWQNWKYFGGSKMGKNGMWLIVKKKSGWFDLLF